MMPPKISFIIPTFNAEMYLERCLSSISNQDYPKDRLEIIIIDGGSTDLTIEISKGFNARILDNPKKLAEYGVQIGILNANGDLVVMFAADNELISTKWAKTIISPFLYDRDISAVWGRISAPKDSPGLNKYFALIQNEPLNYFVNKNLELYLNGKYNHKIDNFCIFYVDPQKPIVWGANGLTYRKEIIRPIWDTGEYLGDNDAFQIMVEKGINKVAYFNEPFIYHHHVRAIKDCFRKWRRNYTLHYLRKRKTRNLKWVFSKRFMWKLLIWAIYSCVPVFSFIHGVYLAIRFKNRYWFYHPLVSFVQLFTYSWATLTTNEGRLLIRDKILGEKFKSS